MKAKYKLITQIDKLYLTASGDEVMKSVFIWYGALTPAMGEFPHPTNICATNAKKDIEWQMRTKRIHCLQSNLNRLHIAAETTCATVTAGTASPPEKWYRKCVHNNYEYLTTSHNSPKSSGCLGTHLLIVICSLGRIINTLRHKAATGLWWVFVFRYCWMLTSS